MNEMGDEREVGKKTQPVEYILRPRREQPEWENYSPFTLPGQILLWLKRCISSEQFI
jgi:hypothetical protein